MEENQRREEILKEMDELNTQINEWHEIQINDEETQQDRTSETELIKKATDRILNLQKELEQLSPREEETAQNVEKVVEEKKKDPFQEYLENLSKEISQKNETTISEKKLEKDEEKESELPKNSEPNMPEEENKKENPEKDVENMTPEELLEQLKKGEIDTKKQKTELTLSIEKLEDEKKAYESQKNTAYKDIYQEYENAIQKKKEELENLEKNEIEGKNKKIRILTQGKMMQEEKITEIKKKIESKQREIKNIQYGTEKAMQDKKLKDGTNAKVPKVFEQYKQLFKLQEELEKEIAKQNEYQTYINQLKGIEKEEKPQYTQKQMEEYTKYFHGQGDIPENNRDDKRANDEYFGFEKNRNLNSEQQTNTMESKETTGIPPKGKMEPSNGTTGIPPKGKTEPSNGTTGTPPKDKIEFIEIQEEKGEIYYRDSKGILGKMYIEEAMENGKNLLKNSEKIKEACKKIAGNRIKGAVLKRKLNPEVLAVLEGYPEQMENYITSIGKGEKGEIDLIHNLENTSFLNKLKLNRFVRAEKNAGAIVKGQLFEELLEQKETEKLDKPTEKVSDKKATKSEEIEQSEDVKKKTNERGKNMIETLREAFKKGMDRAKGETKRTKDSMEKKVEGAIKSNDGTTDRIVHPGGFVEKIENRDNHIEETALRNMEKQAKEGKTVEQDKSK